MSTRLWAARSGDVVSLPSTVAACQARSVRTRVHAIEADRLERRPCVSVREPFASIDAAGRWVGGPCSQCARLPCGCVYPLTIPREPHEVYRKHRIRFKPEGTKRVCPACRPRVSFWRACLWPARGW